MKTDAPVILIASASSYERHRLELALKTTGWTLCEVKSADEVTRVRAADGGAAILVIDSGVLESHRDPQWRTLRSRDPQLSAVVRCLVPRGAMLRADPRTCLVHPDDFDNLCEAVTVLSGT